MTKTIRLPPCWHYYFVLQICFLGMINIVTGSRIANSVEYFRPSLLWTENVSTENIVVKKNNQSRCQNKEVVWTKCCCSWCYGLWCNVFGSLKVIFGIDIQNAKQNDIYSSSTKNDIYSCLLPIVCCDTHRTKIWKNEKTIRPHFVLTN